MTNPLYCLYLLNCDNDILYTGIAINPVQRLKHHQSKKPPGAKFTRRFKDLKLVYQVTVGNRSQAQNLEYHVKQLCKQDKITVIEQQLSLTELQDFISLKTV
ncbi:GIY-YIG nuclease family protein [Marinicella gelatinilytica]|uniref:GIY-YIG nuclease family protein n=1 Tax=Marinicella gelatinilytica TaxID=2996017 RepID=UPI002260B656|nr:GIY-YIG nuclease family protein [Marinicella gelatinilytica]MCX7544063.1 GIY-YIG nuclease family protein [Marinicella gelatinilytica]